MILWRDFNGSLISDSTFDGLIPFNKLPSTQSVLGPVLNKGSG